MYTPRSSPLILTSGFVSEPILRCVRHELGVNTHVERGPPESVPEVGKVSIDETRLSGGSDADSRFGDLSSKVRRTRTQSMGPVRSRLG